MQRVPLEGVRVVAVESGAVGPSLTRALGELGADVIKLEWRGNLDFMRVVVGPDIHRSTGFNEANRNKRSFGVNLKTEKGIEIARQFIKMSDIVVDNWRGGVVEGLGLGYEDVRQFKPDIIYFSSCGAGRGGPYSRRQAYGPLNLAMSGVQYLWSHPDDPYPVGGTIPHPDHVAALYGVVVILAALDYKRRTGKGQFIDMAQTEAAAAMVGESYLEYTMNNRAPEPVGNRNPWAAPHGCYRCKGDDEWCVISVFTNDEWQRFCDVMGNPAWTKRPKFADTPSRLRNVDELDKLIEKWTVTRDPKEVMETLQAAGIAAAKVQRGSDMVNDPQLRELGGIVEVDHAVVGKQFYPGIPFKLSNAPPLKSTPGVLYGEHTEEICREMLGMSDDEIKKLKEEGVLEGVFDWIEKSSKE